MGNSRLHGLVQMSIIIMHDLPIDPEKVMDKMAIKKQRLNFVP